MFRETRTPIVVNKIQQKPIKKNKKTIEFEEDYPITLEK